MEDLERYLNEIVDPTITDLENNRTSVRHTFLACVAVFHAIDYLAYPNGKAYSLRQKFGRKNRDFKIVDTVAHAFKHVRTGNPAKPDLIASEVISRPPGFFGVGFFDISRFDDPHGGVTLNRDRNVDLYQVIMRARKFLGEQLQLPTSPQTARSSSRIRS